LFALLLNWRLYLHNKMETLRTEVGGPINLKHYQTESPKPLFPKSFGAFDVLLEFLRIWFRLLCVGELFFCAFFCGRGVAYSFMRWSYKLFLWDWHCSLGLPFALTGFACVSQLRWDNLT